MRTWANANQRADSLDAAGRAAQDIIRTAGHNKATNRRALKEQLTEIVWTGEVSDREDLLYRLRLLVDPFGKGTTKGPEGAAFSAEILTALITDRIEALQALQRDEATLPDGIWEWARFTLLWSRGFYLQAQPQLLNDPSLQKHPEMAHLYRPETFQTMMNSACLTCSRSLRSQNKRSRCLSSSFAFPRHMRRTVGADESTRHGPQCRESTHKSMADPVFHSLGQQICAT